MNVISADNTIIITALPAEAALIVHALRDKNTRHEQERTMTPQLKNKLINAIMLIEEGISQVSEKPELPQKIYDFQS